MLQNDWDAAEYAIDTALLQLMNLQAQVPEDVAHTATRNRIVMAQGHLDEARDMLAAAKARLPK